FSSNNNSSQQVASFLLNTLSAERTPSTQRLRFLVMHKEKKRKHDEMPHGSLKSQTETGAPEGFRSFLAISNKQEAVQRGSRTRHRRSSDGESMKTGRALERSLSQMGRDDEGDRLDGVGRTQRHTLSVCKESVEHLREYYSDNLNLERSQNETLSLLLALLPLPPANTHHVPFISLPLPPRRLIQPEGGGVCVEDEPVLASL
ncbi:hypothetical protein KUCAC02_032414, partial [Chaenocephalus aceratus]